jgi:lipopolysaccharide export system protein LptA
MLPLPAPGPRSHRLQLRADELSLQPGTRRLELRGHARIELDGIRLQAGRLQVELDAKGRPLRLEARGAVRVQVGAASGLAEELSLVLGSAGRQLELRKRARLAGVGELPLALEGERIHLDLVSGKLTVSSARARLGAQGGGR